jgi:hypothetical protein
MRKKIIAILIFCSFSLTSFPTCIVVVVTPSGVFLAADSKQIDQQKSSYRVSKIYEIGNYYVACAGLIKDLETNYDPIKTIAASFKNMKGYDTSIVRKNKLSLIKSVKAELEFMNRKHRNEIDSIVDLFCYCFIGLKNGIPFMYSLELKKGRNEGSIVPTEKYFDISGRRTAQILAFGAREEIYLRLKQKPPALNQNNIIAYIKSLIQIAIESHPEAVGPPIDILELTCNGFMWREENNKHNILSFN